MLDQIINICTCRHFFAHLQVVLTSSPAGELFSPFSHMHIFHEMQMRSSPFLMSLAFCSFVSIIFTFSIYAIFGNFQQSWIIDSLRVLLVSGLAALSTAITLSMVIKSISWWLFPISFALQICFTIFFIVFIFVGFNNVL